MPVIIRAAGVVDEAGPATPNEAFVPYERSLPALDALAAATGGPVMPIVMAWEREGPWVYPDALPPVGGSCLTRRVHRGGPGARLARRDLLQRDAVGGRSCVFGV